METTIRNLVGIILVLLFLDTASAARTALVAVEGAMVYGKPDFDSAVIGYLPRGQKVRISTKAFGPFHKIRFREGVNGFISDVDVVTEDGTPLSSVNSGEATKSEGAKTDAADAPPGKKGRKKKQTEKPVKTKPHLPVANAIAFGPAVGLISYKELVLRREYGEQMLTYGFRFSTRAPFLQGPYGLDLTFLMYLQGPKYFEKAVGAPAKGTYFFVDAVWTFPLYEVMGKDGMFVMGIGPLFTYSDAKATVNGQEFKQSDMVIGASFQAGLAFRFGRMILKTDVKYYLDKNSYLGYLGSVQYEF